MVGPESVLDDQHREVLDRAMRNALGTDLALETYSQIIDGLPLASVAFDQYGQRCPNPHPIARHTSLCPGALETAREFLSVFGIGTLDFDVKVGHPHRITIRVAQRC